MVDKDYEIGPGHWLWDFHLETEELRRSNEKLKEYNARLREHNARLREHNDGIKPVRREKVREIVINSLSDKGFMGKLKEFMTPFTTYLNHLRERRAVNVFTAEAKLREQFPNLSSKQAKVILRYWFENFPTNT